MYPSIAEWFPPRGVAVYALDTRGNGRSPGRRGHIDGWREYRDDLHHFVEFVREREGTAPVLLGHSLGGLMVLDYALEHPSTIRGVAAAAPVLGSIGTPAPLLWLARLLSRTWPTFTLETGLDLSGLARDPAVIRAVLDDPLFHRSASARLATEVFATIASVHARAATLAGPALIQHGVGRSHGLHRRQPPLRQRSGSGARSAARVRCVARALSRTWGMRSGWPISRAGWNRSSEAPRTDTLLAGCQASLSTLRGQAALRGLCPPAPRLSQLRPHPRAR